MKREGQSICRNATHCGFNTLVKDHLTDICIVTNIAGERVSSAAVRYPRSRIVDFSFKLLPMAHISALPLQKGCILHSPGCLAQRDL